MFDKGKVKPLQEGEKWGGIERWWKGQRTEPDFAKSSNAQQFGLLPTKLSIIFGGSCPGSRIPSGACQPKFKVARSLRKCVFCDKFEIVGLMVFPSELRQQTWRVLHPILDIIISEK